MKTKIILVVLIITILLTISGCGSKVLDDNDLPDTGSRIGFEVVEPPEPTEEVMEEEAEELDSDEDVMEAIDEAVEVLE